jgi:hypothetical protein
VNRYPFAVRNRGSVVVVADTLANAINKVLMRYPNRFVRTTFARNVEKYLQRLNERERVIITRNSSGMVGASLVNDADLLEDLTPLVKSKQKFAMNLVHALKQAAKHSAHGKSVYVNVDPTGQCLLYDKPDETTYAAFHNGVEVAVPMKIKTVKRDAVESSPQTKTNSSMKISAKNGKDVAAKKAPAKGKTVPIPNVPAKGKKAVVVDDEEEDEELEQEVELVVNKAKGKKKVVEEDDDDDDAPAKPSKQPVKGKIQELTVTELIAAINKGMTAYTKSGKTLHSLEYLKKIADKTTIRECILVKG